jgi:ribonucleoside-triphosphate reductase
MSDTNKLIEEVLERKTWKLSDNSNTQMSPSLVDLYISSSAVEEYALNKLYSKNVVKAHKEGLIYIHTLHGAFKPYCNGIDTRVVLLDGLKFPHCNSAPAKHLSSAVFQTMAFMFYSQLFFSGAQAMDYYNWFMAPYLRHEKLDYKEIKQIIQGFVFQLNQSNRTGAQSAFTNIGLRINCPSYLENEKVIYAGKHLEQTYKQFKEEARIIYKAFMEVMGEGDGSGAPFTFPIITTAITKDLDWDDPLFDATIDTAIKTGSPYFFNLTADYLDEKYVHAMCCRLLVEHSGGIWMAGGLGTGSNKVVTLNLPHIALISKSRTDFMKNLDSAMLLARKALRESNDIIDMSLNKWKILPFLKMKTKDGVPYYNFNERRLTFGAIGMNECLLNLIGEEISSGKGQELAEEIVSRIAGSIAKYSKKDRITYTLEQTPAESATHKLAMADRKRFGKKAHVQGKIGEYYYSNSTHVPYSADVSLADKVRIESQFHPYFSGGVISHIWIGENKPDHYSMKNLIRKMAATKMAYFAFSPDFSVCVNKHVSWGKQKKCPECSGKIVDYINRIVGYFTRTSNWNPGKKREFEERKRFVIK